VLVLSDYATSCGYAVDKQKTKHGFAVVAIEPTGDKTIMAVDAEAHGMNDQGQRTRFENQMLPLMPEAYNLARWFMKNEPDARDVVQDAYLKAFRYFESFHGDSGRAWLLRIVRNVCYDALRARDSQHNIVSLDEETADEVPDSKPSPNALAIQNSTKLRIQEAVEALPLQFKTVIILREFDGFSYKEISEIAGVPVGTVMSRLSRARQQLAILLQEEGENE
jgi:RNA polymerase sigma-70 factor (ECF subfamily)